MLQTADGLFFTCLCVVSLPILQYSSYCHPDCAALHSQCSQQGLQLVFRAQRCSYIVYCSNLLAIYTLTFELCFILHMNPSCTLLWNYV